ncbi:MAG TPA: 4-hydroxy-tetrahydrodipicolinate synthase [Microthrixaceae bacterium]|jgi:4-hydroxy-tetrahydrodipicolinate synthase|nr:4-hydroxy-tetrahydrodipicolinate synthase [Microthrixaceae bacterium]HQF95793.1 4-hydroxy-tetrahydrodipicolinate synthase [Microthrixaceae bacterium]
MSLDAPRFGRVITAMVTPFDEGGALDLDSAANLAAWLVDNGSDGLVLAGTTGESPVLSDSEEVALTRAVRSAVKVPLLLGTGSNDTAYAVSATRRAEQLGVDGVLVVGPYYNRPSQAGLDHYFRSVAAATPLPVVIYDIPVRTGRKINTATMLRLVHEVPNLVGLKDAAGNPAETARFLRDAPDGFEVYSGDDPFTLPLLSVGAVGVISVASHWAGRQIGDMIAAFAKGDIGEAVRLNQGLIESYEFETGDEAPNPVPTKAMLRVLGLKVGQCRPPMGVAPDWLEPRAREVLAGLT